MAGQFLIEIWIEPSKYIVRAQKSQEFIKIDQLLAFLRQQIKAIEQQRTEGTN